MLTELKPCPFCGAQPEAPDVGDYFVECPSCGVQGPISNKDGQPHAKEEWNRRAQPTVKTKPIAPPNLAFYGIAETDEEFAERAGRKVTEVAE